MNVGVELTGAKIHIGKTISRGRRQRIMLEVFEMEVCLGPQKGSENLSSLGDTWTSRSTTLGSYVSTKCV
jgi:hypothetical protein